MELRVCGALVAAPLSFLAPAAPASSQAKAPHVSTVRCVADCGGLRAGAEGSTFRWTGRHLAHVRAIRFPARGGGRAAAKPLVPSSRRVRARVPAGAAGGRPSLLTPNRSRAFARAPVRIVKPGDLVPERAFSLLHSRAHPRTAFFDGRRVHIRFRFRARSFSDI